MMLTDLVSGEGLPPVAATPMVQPVVVTTRRDSPLLGLLMPLQKLQSHALL